MIYCRMFGTQMVQGIVKAIWFEQREARLVRGESGLAAWRVMKHTRTSPDDGQGMLFLHTKAAAYSLVFCYGGVLGEQILSEI